MCEDSKFALLVGRPPNLLGCVRLDTRYIRCVKPCLFKAIDIKINIIMLYKQKPNLKNDNNSDLDFILSGSQASGQ